MGHGHASKSFAAQRAAIAMGETFSAVNIPFEIIGFNNEYAIGTRGVRDAEAFDRWLPFRFNVFKAFDERFQAVKERLVHICGRQENVDGEAVMECAKRLAARPEKRKIMFVLSDGSPCGGGRADRMQKHLRAVIRMITKAGIEVYGVGLSSPAVANYYNKAQGAESINIDDIGQLAPKMFRLLKAKMTA